MTPTPTWLLSPIGSQPVDVQMPHNLDITDAAADLLAANGWVSPAAVESLLLAYSEWLDVSARVIISDVTPGVDPRAHQQLVRDFLASPVDGGPVVPHD